MYPGCSGVESFPEASGTIAAPPAGKVRPKDRARIERTEADVRAPLLIPLAVLLTAAAGWVVCGLLGWDPHPRELAIAGVGAGVAGALGFAPLVLARRADQAGTAQAALFGTLVHMLALAVVAAVVYFGTRPARPLAQAFLCWLLAFYWTTLMALVASFTQSIRAAPAGAK